MGGFIPLYRKIQNHPFYKEKRVFSKYEAWIDMLMEVRYQKEPEDVLIGMKLVKCGYGQSIKSLRTWAERWGWTAKKVSRFFDLLKKMGQIRHENVTVTTRITVLNYDKYCHGGHGSVTDVSQKGNTHDTQMKHECPTDNKENNINKEKKEIINPEFEKFWSMYDKKEDKKKCVSKWNKLKVADKKKIFDTLPYYLQKTQNKKYRKNPLTYLNGECWNDEIKPERSIRLL